MVKPSHILVIRFSAMGDVAMMYPVLKSILSQYPDLKITVLTRAFFKPIFEDLPQVEVYTADLKGRHKGILGLYKLAKELKKLNISAVADLHNVLRTKILKLFLGNFPLYQIDKGRDEKRSLTEGKIFKPLKPTTERYADVFRKLGFQFDLVPKLALDRKPLPESLLKFFAKKELRCIGIAPFAAHESKVYPLEKMMAVVDGLAKNNQILLFGAPGSEADRLEELSQNKSNVFNLAGKFGFADELKIISNLDAMISMDSGNGHLAANYGVPIISLWGVTHPYAGFAPYGQPLENSLMADRTEFPKIPTSVYGNKFPKGYEIAIATIKPDDIITKVNEVLGN